jgi:hypothetical protein
MQDEVVAVLEQLITPCGGAVPPFLTSALDADMMSLAPRPIYPEETAVPVRWI